MAKINEKELKKLLIELKTNHKETIEKIYTQYNKIVYGIAFSLLKNKEDAEDIVQTVFSKLYEMDKNKLPTQKEASWLYTVTKNEVLTFLRKKGNDVDLENIYDLESTDNEINKIIEQENYNQLISRLSNKEKEIISLKILANLSFEEIGRLLNQPTSTVKWRYYKSVHTLKIALSNLGMFIVAFVIGMETIFSKKETPNYEQVEENVTQNTVINTDKNQESKEELKNKTKGDSNLEKLEEQQNLQDETINHIEEDYENRNEIIQETTVVEEQKENNINYMGVSFLMLSILFLITSIIFFIKYQLKLKKKTSK